MPTAQQRDPTRSITLRNAYRREMRVRFGALRKDIVELVVKQDVFGLKPSKPIGPDSILYLASPDQWRFQTNAGKVREFRSWLQNRIDVGILEQVGDGKPWTNRYVDSAYRKGVVRAYTDANKFDAVSNPDGFDTTQRSFLNTVFAQPESVAKLEALYTRNFVALQGVTSQMDSDMTRILTGGLARGDNPLKMAKQMTDSISSLTRRRAETIARTEIIYAHSEGQLDSYELLGVEELGVEIEWSTAGDDRVCPRCTAMEGEIYTTQSARGIIPLHPNCRCTWIPYFPPSNRKPSKR